MGILGVCKLPASYQQVRGGWLDGGDKSGIWRFYRRVWKNIFYERRDKERERGFLGMGGGKFGLRRMGREREKGERIGGFWVEWEMGCDMEYSLMECFL